MTSPIEEFDFASPSATADPSSRTIVAVAIPSGATTERWGRTVRIPPDAVLFPEDRTVPLLRFHAEDEPIGKVVSWEITDQGLVVTCKVSEVPAGDETLRLCADGVLAVSCGLSIADSALQVTADEVVITEATVFEISVTPLPALATEVLSVTFTAGPIEKQLNSKGKAMTDTGQGVDVAALNSTMSKLTDAVMTLSSRPVPQPVVPAMVTREPAYDFNVQDLKLSLAGDVGAKEKISRYLTERFAVTQENVSPLTPRGFRADLYQGPRPFARTLTQLMTQSTIPDNNPFGVPYMKAQGAGPWIQDHVQNVEPELADSPLWDTMVVVPKPLSSKISIVQEALDLSHGNVASMVWDLMLSEYEKSLEKRMAEFLDGLTLPANQVVDVDGTNADLSDSFDELMLSLREDRWTGLAAASPLYRDFFKARDEDKRKLFPAVGQIVNGDGSANSRRSLDLSGVLAVQSRDTAHSYLVDASILHQFSTVPQRFDIRTRVASLEIGFFAYECHACLSTDGIIRIDHVA